MTIDLDAATRAWAQDGFVVLPEFFSANEFADGVGELTLLFPTADEFHGGHDPERNARFADEFGGIDTFPLGSTALNLLAVHPRLVRLAEHLLGMSDLRVFSIEAWAKYTGAADYDQDLHRDYLGHSLMAPSSDPAFAQAELFVYLSDVPPELGPPSYVSLEHTQHLPAIPNWYPRIPKAPGAEHPTWGSAQAWPELYDHEVSATGPAGTVVAYSNRTFHRGTQLTHPGGARFTLHVCFRPAGSEWQAQRSWVERVNTWEWHDFVNNASPNQLALFGWPRPGHPYWNADTIASTRQRYPALAVTPWEADHRVGERTVDREADEVELVVAHSERATLRVGDVFLKIDGDDARARRETRAMALAPVPTPKVLWHEPPVLAIAAVPGRPLGRLGEPSTASSAAWIAAGAAVRRVHEAPVPPWAGRRLEGLRAGLDAECDWLISNGVLPVEVVARNRERAEAALEPRPMVFIHGDLQVDHVFVADDQVTAIIDWSEASPGDAVFDLATLTLGNEEHLHEVIAGYGREINPDLIRAWWALRCLSNIRWLTEHGYGPPENYPEVAVLQSLA